MSRIAVIGAGPMGLACAYQFVRQGHAVTVFEADDRLGGMSASFDFDGVLLERYYHFINLPDTHLFDLLRELGLEDTLRWVPTKMGFFRRGKDGKARLHPYGNPLALLRFSDIPLFTRLRYGLHVLACKHLKDLSPLDAVSAKDWITRWEGPAGYDLFWRFLFEKKFFELADPLSAAWIASRVRRVAKSRKSLMEERLGYLEGGSQSLLDVLAGRIREMGGDVRLSCPARRLVHAGGRLTGVEWSEGVEAFDAAVSTVPLPLLDGLLPDSPPAYGEKLRQCRNVGCACALFRLGRPLTDNFWVNVDVDGWDAPGVIEYSNLRPMDRSYVYVPFYMPQDHPKWAADTATLLAKGREILAGINPAAAATEEAARLFRYTYAQPVCPPRFQAQLPPYATGIDGLYAADTAHAFPEDRSINESVRIGRELADLVG
ncbi:FAD-dependent oxidoreductase [Desulfovibrio aerotolerans]|uniref:FAD-dependent oxidoreductase n=1 Tax=Solidesulfovibrio aerotolerans TaxID=295255 RepID=A0A7C9INM6_9BACT|nr:NAD(P)/FAD-dependent oxidoreductase [Solidesulfovibrio aerotolerans]MYL85205.1 FAD-dependent oxidoreductase [Solidesulfovibrio aerotolerans]